MGEELQNIGTLTAFIDGKPAVFVSSVGVEGLEFSEQSEPVTPMPNISWNEGATFTATAEIEDFSKLKKYTKLPFLLWKYVQRRKKRIKKMIKKLDL